jgi:trehalose utilization protein
MSQSEALDRIDRRSFARRVMAATTAASGLSLLGPGARPAEAKTPALRVRVWSEGTAPRSVYPDDVDGAIGDHLRRQEGLEVKRARLGEPASGLSDEALDGTDVLIWWGRLRHADLPDARAKAIADRVRAGKLGFVALHASCGSKPFRELMGGPCEPGDWREDGRPERVTIEAPDHEIARGVAPFTLPRTAMYAEPFQVPRPETVVFMSKFDGDITFRSGLTWTVGKGRVAYFRPGHDAFPILYHPSVRRVIANAARWASPRPGG